MSVVPLRWKLEQVLKEHGLSAYKVAKEANVSKTTIYAIKNGRANTVQGHVLEKMLQTIYELTGTRYNVGDLLEWEPTNADNVS